MTGSSDRTKRPYGPSTLAVHAGEERQKALHSVTDPIVCAATYSFASTQAVIDYIEQKQDRGEYGRYGFAGEKVVERKLASLEGGQDAVVYSSGMAAIVGLFMAKLNAGDEVVFFDECYHRSREFCAKHLSRFGVVTRQVKACDYDAMAAAINAKTRLLVSESPTNPHLSCVDLARFAELGRKHNVETLIDATLGTPYNFQPLSYGIDYVLHSATKYLGGHSDLLLGAAAARDDELARRLRERRLLAGAIPGSLETYLA
ncbi:MAG: aminotransferase class I/II-fold pyridoxal phosphate-dependent enzyme, partial [Vicinamibacterales bacterium]